MVSKLQHLQNLRQIFLTSVDSVRPANLLTETKNFRLQPKQIGLGGESHFAINVQGKTFDITDKRCHVVGFGKAVLGMAVQLERALSTHLHQGILSIPVGSLQEFQNRTDMQLSENTCITVLEGAPNNQPDARAMEAAVGIKELATQLTSNDILFVLISGGGSALLTLPKDPLTLDEKLQLVSQLANSGATIEEMNVVRIALSDIKGGRLAISARNAAAIISFVISDIVNYPIDLIASGPTCNPIRRKFNAQDVLMKYKMWSALPKHIQKLINDAISTSPATDTESMKNNFIYVVGDNCVATSAAVACSLKFDYHPFIASTTVQGDVQQLVETYTTLLHSIRSFQRQKITEAELNTQFPFNLRIFQHFLKTLLHSTKTGKPLLIILGGEPTVKVTGKGRGGRNQELALRMSLALYEEPDFHDICFLSAGTDGIDGPTPVAGAVGSSCVIEEYLKSSEANLKKVRECLNNNDSYNFYHHLNAGEYHIITGHTGTNVMDLQLLLVP